MDWLNHWTDKIFNPKSKKAKIKWQPIMRLWVCSHERDKYGHVGAGKTPLIAYYHWNNKMELIKIRDPKSYKRVFK